MSVHGNGLNLGVSSPRISEPQGPVAASNTEASADSLPSSARTTSKKAPEEYRVKELSAENYLKTDGSNFTAWRRIQRLILRNHRWEAYVNRTVPCPAYSGDPGEYETWQQIDSLALSQLAMNMDLTLYGEISTDDMTSAELWKAINDWFEEHSELAQTTAHAKLCGKRIQDGESIKQHFIELRRLESTYVNYGGRLTEQQWHTVIVTSLDAHSQWSQFDIYADSIEEPEKLIRKLELKGMRGFGKVNKVEQALLNQQQPQSGRKNNSRGSGTLCSNCGKEFLVKPSVVG